MASSFQDIVLITRQYFPNIHIKYKNESKLMDLLSKVLFFNKKFMTLDATTINSTIYFPTIAFTKLHKISSIVILLHELMHMEDSKNFTKILFGALYLTPQIFVLLAIPLFFINWILGVITLIFLLPIPSFFRMYFEKRAYISSIYVIYQLSKKMDFNPALEKQKSYFIKKFQNATYYYAWPFNIGLNNDFDNAIKLIQNDQKPLPDKIFNTFDKIIAQI